MLSSSPSTSSPLSRPPHKRSSSSGTSDHLVYTPSSGERLTLPEFVSQHHKSLPLPIRVCRGYCGPSEETSISEGDHFNVHFVKHTTVVLVEMDNGYQYNVPLNSAVPFALLFDPYKNLSQASKGFTFTRVADILQQSEIPPVVRARKSHASSNPENSIVANELLIIRRAARKRIGKNQLKVFSLTSKREKTLSENCIGHFSTKPRDVCMYLPDIVKHAPDVFPCRAVLFANKETSNNHVPSVLSSSAVTLMHHSIETSLVVTSALEEDTENSKMLDIPIDLNIQVRVATVTEVDAQKLARNTAYLYNHFNPSNMRSYFRSAQNRRMEETQNLLYRTIRLDHRQRGIKITRPSSILFSDDTDTISEPSPNYSEACIYDDITPVEEPRYMSPRPATLACPEGPPLPERNKTQKRTPGYSYVEVDSFRTCVSNRATRAVGVAADSVGTGDQASGSSSFGSTGSGGAVVERSMSGATGGRAIGGNTVEYSNRSSYSEGDLEVRRRRQSLERTQQPAVAVQETPSNQEDELDSIIRNLRDMGQELDMAQELDSVLEEGERWAQGEGGERVGGEGEDAYSTLQHSGPQRKSSKR